MIEGPSLHTLVRFCRSDHEIRTPFYLRGRKSILHVVLGEGGVGRLRDISGMAFCLRREWMHIFSSEPLLISVIP